MPVPNHGPECRTTTYPTTCRDCGQEVYVMKCTCGSCVLFDELGEPWTLHEESCPGAAARELIADGWTPRDIRDLIQREARTRGIEAGHHGSVHVGAPASRSRRREPVEVPPDGLAEVSGRILSLRACRDMLVRLNVKPTAMARAFMGKLADRAYTEVLLESDQCGPDEQQTRYRFFVEYDTLDAEVVAIGVSLSASLVARSVPGQGPIWLARSVRKA